MEQIFIAGSRKDRMWEIGEVDCRNVAKLYLLIKAGHEYDMLFGEQYKFRPGGFRETIRDLMLAGF